MSGRQRTYVSSPAARAANVEFVERHLVVQQRSDDEWSVLCPIHSDNNASMRINIAKGVFYCHGCHVRGTLSKLAWTLKLPYRRLNSQEAGMSTLMAKLGKLREGGITTAPAAFWEEKRLDRYRSVQTPWWTDQPRAGCGFTANTIDSFDLGYDPIEEQAIIPIRDMHGRLLGVTRRNLGRDSRIKYKDPKGFDKSGNLFAAWFLPQVTAHYVVLVEGPKDCMKVWQAGHPSVAQYGSYITPEQIRILRHLGITTVITMYDNDEGGRTAWRASRGIITTLARGAKKHHYDPSRDLRRFFITKRAAWRTDHKDPGETPEKEIDKMVRRAPYIS